MDVEVSGDRVHEELVSGFGSAKASEKPIRSHSISTVGPLKNVTKRKGESH